MSSKEHPAPQLTDQDIAAIKEDLHESSLIIKEDIKNDAEYAGEADSILNIIQTLETGLNNVKTYDDLSEEEWNRIFADMSDLHDMLEEIYLDDELAEEEFDEDLTEEFDDEK